METVKHTITYREETNRFEMTIETDRHRKSESFYQDEIRSHFANRIIDTITILKLHPERGKKLTLVWTRE